MIFFLKARQLLDVCLNKQVIPFNVETEAKNNCTLFQLSSTVDNSIYNSIFKLTPNITAYNVWFALKTIFSLCKVWRMWDTIHCDKGLVSYVDRCLECLGKFKTIGYNTTQNVFAACIITRVTTIKQSLMDSLMVDEVLVNDPYLLLEKLRTFAVHKQTMLKYDNLSKGQASTSAL
jgi:hypothetical protein